MMESFPFLIFLFFWVRATCALPSSPSHTPDASPFDPTAPSIETFDTRVNSQLQNLRHSYSDLDPVFIRATTSRTSSMLASSYRTITLNLYTPQAGLLIEITTDPFRPGSWKPYKAEHVQDKESELARMWSWESRKTSLQKAFDVLRNEGISDAFQAVQMAKRPDDPPGPDSDQPYYLIKGGQDCRVVWLGAHDRRIHPFPPPTTIVSAHGLSWNLSSNTSAP